MTDPTVEEYAFFSRNFRIDPAEEEETNPYLFGRALATWLANKLRQRGYSAEVLAEDWGWGVFCQHQPFGLFVICVGALNRSLVEQKRDPSSSTELLWRVIPLASQSLFQQLRGKHDPRPMLTRLQRDVKSILDAEAGIRFASEQELEEADDEANALIATELAAEYEPAPLSRWITVPLGLFLLPILLICAVGSASLLFDNPEEFAVIRPIVGTVMLILILILSPVVVRMVIGRPNRPGGLFPPLVLRLCAGLFFLLPIGGLFTGWYVEHPGVGTAQAIAYFSIAAGLWRLATTRAMKLAAMRESEER